MPTKRPVVLALVAALLATTSVMAQRGGGSSPADRERVGGFLARGQLAELSPPVAEGFAPVFVVPRFEAIVDVPVISPDQVSGEVNAAELVIGLVLNGESRAYPINMLTGPEREVVNDVLGGRQIAATWCHLCNNAIIYDREFGGQTLTLAVSGMLWRRNLVMYDLNTGSLWAHFNGTAMQGELIGNKLAMLPAELTTWGDWSYRHPETTVLDMSRTATAYEAGVFEETERFAYGWNLPGEGAYHVGIDVLERNRTLNVASGRRLLVVSYDQETSRVTLASRQVDGQTLTFERLSDGRLRDAETESLWDPLSLEATSGRLAGTRLEQVVGMFAFRDAWEEFHPASEEIE